VNNGLAARLVIPDEGNPAGDPVILTAREQRLDLEGKKEREEVQIKDDPKRAAAGAVRPKSVLGTEPHRLMTHP